MSRGVDITLFPYIINQIYFLYLKFKKNFKKTYFVYNRIILLSNKLSQFYPAIAELIQFYKHSFFSYGSKPEIFKLFRRANLIYLNNILKWTDKSRCTTCRKVNKDRDIHYLTHDRMTISVGLVVRDGKQSGLNELLPDSTNILPPWYYNYVRKYCV